MRYLVFLSLIFSSLIFAQSTIEESKLKVFEPNENSVVYNQIYTQNFFFGNFGLKQLINAAHINNQSVKSIKISATSSAKPVSVMELYYNKDGKLTQMKVLESFFGKAMTVDYQYKNGLIEKETITKKENNKNKLNINYFYYKDGKMVIKNFRKIIDVYSLNEKVLSKKSYIDGNLVFDDKMEGNCRLTYYKQEAIDKMCFSNLQLELPLTIEEFTNNEGKDGKPKLMKDRTLEIKKNNESEYSVLINEKEQYILKLDKDKRLKEFNFLGNKTEKVGAVNYKFNYTYY